MTFADVHAIASWHAHIYFDATSRDAAWALRAPVESRFGNLVRIGRFHERPVGPHPMWSWQIAIENDQFAELIAWLTLNHGSLDVFVHPNTGDALRDHRDAALWIGHSHELTLSALGT